MGTLYTCAPLTTQLVYAPHDQVPSPVAFPSDTRPGPCQCATRVPEGLTAGVPADCDRGIQKGPARSSRRFTPGAPHRICMVSVTITHDKTPQFDSLIATWYKKSGYTASTTDKTQINTVNSKTCHSGRQTRNNAKTQLRSNIKQGLKKNCQLKTVMRRCGYC
jgi:hypothetical protein